RLHFQTYECVQPDQWCHHKQVGVKVLENQQEVLSHDVFAERNSLLSRHGLFSHLLAKFHISFFSSQMPGGYQEASVQLLPYLQNQQGGSILLESI
ncbi:UNVERIFIED_CONTAM: hypothetical protein Slati_0388700, partial [Sesamum latifolium]